MSCIRRTVDKHVAELIDHHAASMLICVKIKRNIAIIVDGRQEQRTAVKRNLAGGLGNSRSSPSDDYRSGGERRYSSDRAGCRFYDDGLRYGCGCRRYG